MTVKRYTPTQCCEYDGTYVTYSDYQKLVAENAALKDINAWCRTDAFKNMYREFKIAEAAGCDTVDCMHDAMLTAIMHAPATPAADAAIAEIKLPLAAEVDACRQFIKDLGIACSMTAPETDHLLNHYKAQGVDEFANDFQGNAHFSRIAEFAREFAANLRAGRKG